MADKPKLPSVKIKIKPIGEIVVTVTGGTPSDYTMAIVLTVFDPNEPGCTNNPIAAAWNSSTQEYTGVGVFSGSLVPSGHGYNADVSFLLNGVPQPPPDRNIQVEVVSPPES